MGHVNAQRREKATIKTKQIEQNDMKIFSEPCQ